MAQESHHCRPGTSSPMMTMGMGRKLRYRKSHAPMRAARVCSAALIMTAVAGAHGRA
jgi:hypothetical protein